jgi:hypothetical protein
MLGRQWCHVSADDLRKELRQSNSSPADIRFAIAEAQQSRFVEPILEFSQEMTANGARGSLECLFRFALCCSMRIPANRDRMQLSICGIAMLPVSTPASRSRTPWVRVVPVVSAARLRVVHRLKVHR